MPFCCATHSPPLERSENDDPPLTVSPSTVPASVNWTTGFCDALSLMRTVFCADDVWGVTENDDELRDDEDEKEDDALERDGRESMRMRYAMGREDELFLGRTISAGFPANGFRKSPLRARLPATAMVK